MYLNTYLAVEYFSDVTGGHNCHLKVKYRGQLEVKHQNLLYSTYGCPFIGFLNLGIHIWHWNTAQMSLDVIEDQNFRSIRGQRFESTV